MSPREPEIFALSRAIGNDPAIAATVRVCCTESPIRGESRLREFRLRPRDAKAGHARGAAGDAWRRRWRAVNKAGGGPTMPAAALF